MRDLIVGSIILAAKVCVEAVLGLLDWKAKR